MKTCPPAVSSIEKSPSDTIVVIQVPDLSVHNLPSLVPPLRFANLCAVLGSLGFPHCCFDIDYEFFRLPPKTRGNVRLFTNSTTGRRLIEKFLIDGSQSKEVEGLV